MDLNNIIAHWTGKLPEGFVQPPLLPTGPPGVLAPAANRPQPAQVL
jgi:hypothetical protein